MNCANGVADASDGGRSSSREPGNPSSTFPVLRGPTFGARRREFGTTQPAKRTARLFQAPTSLPQSDAGLRVYEIRDQYAREVGPLRFPRRRYLWSKPT